MRPKTICSFSVRINRSATPLVSGSRTKAKLGTMPKNFSWFWKYSDMKGLPWSWRTARPPARQGPGFQPRAQQLVLHAQRADAAMRLGERPLLRIVVALTQCGIDPGEPALPPLLQLIDRQAEPPGQAFDRLTLHQPQHHVALARKAPPLAGRQCSDRPLVPGHGQRGRASLALAAHSPNSHIRPFDFFVHPSAPRGS